MLVSPADHPAQRRATAAELWRSVWKRSRGSARGRASSLSKTRARVKRRRRAMECHDDRKRRARDSNVALQDLEKTTLSTCAARGGGSQWCWDTTRPRTARVANTTRLDDAGDKKPEDRSRTEDCPRAGKEAVVQNTVMDDRRADPRRGKKSGPTAGEKSIPNSRANTCRRTKEHTQQQGRARAKERQEHSQLQAIKSIANCRQEPHPEDWLRLKDRKDPRSGRVAAKTRRGT